VASPDCWLAGVVSPRLGNLAKFRIRIEIDGDGLTVANPFRTHRVLIDGQLRLERTLITSTFPTRIGLAYRRDDHVVPIFASAFLPLPEKRRLTQKLLSAGFLEE